MRTWLDTGAGLRHQLPHCSAKRVGCGPGTALLNIPLHQRSIQAPGEQAAGQAALATLLLVHQSHAGQAGVALAGQALQGQRRRKA